MHPHRSLEAKDPTDVDWAQIRMRSSEDVTATRPDSLFADVSRDDVVAGVGQGPS